ncbi:hypothetical protein [Hymenobacter fodinae]|uniref:Uncharacterized protein n=1 Tax=Hymenobacter fodinae TaxID=2510796 RepID=A0A4Z0P5S0_9BACT|nr:hypothetical protein [Hymenobacter fodinae]TGE07742.1 hypothetical protein EU556_08285 [Hymenobacter fodinae]
MQLALPPGTTLNVMLSAPQEAQYVIEVGKAQAKEAELQAALKEVYDLKALTKRMKMSRPTLIKYLNLPECHGGIRHRRAGDKYLVTEQAVREWYGDINANA